MADLIPGAEPFSADGGPNGALVLHGFTGNPGSMRGLAEALAGAGFAVELPRLPGHGTTVDDMLTTSWDDWTAEVDSAYQRLAGRTEQLVVAGLSMGGSLTAWTAIRHPEVAGLVFINAAAEPSPDMRAMVADMVEAGETLMDGIGSDIADPESVETAYDKVPLRPLLTMLDAVVAMQDDLPGITAPALILSSPEDHVVPPSNSEHLAATLGGPVERVSLERSYHVATLDHDKDLINERVVDFAVRVTSG
jgi:carboxylesterase